MPKQTLNSLWNFQDPAGSEVHFRERLRGEEKKKKPSPNERMEIMTQIARTYSLRQKFAEAHALLDGVAASLSDLSPLVRTRYHLERGRTYNSSNHKPEAIREFLLALAAARTPGALREIDYYAVDAIHMLGIAEAPELALAWSELGIAMAERSTDERTKRWLGTFYNNTGWTHFANGNYPQALALFEKNEKFAAKQKDAGNVFIAKWSQAKTHRMLKNVTKSLAMQRTLEKLIKSKKHEPDGYVPEEIAECLYTLGKKKEAKPYFAQAYEMLSLDIWLVKNEKPRLERLKRLLR